MVDAVDRMVNRGEDADELLRAVVDLLRGRLKRVSWVGISLVEDGRLALGPSAGARAGAARLAVPIVYESRAVGELALESQDADAFDDEDRSALERVATLISQHTLVAWDTYGERWSR